MKKTAGKATFTMLRKEDLTGRVFVAGFHGVGSVGWIAVDHLIRMLNAERIGFLETPYMPSYINTVNGKLITPFEIYDYREFVFFRDNIPPDPRDAQRICSTLANFIADNKFKNALLIGGLDNQFRKDESELRIVSTQRYSEVYQRELEILSIPVLEEGLYIAGLLALLLARLEARNFPAITLLPYANADRPDPLAACKAIQCTNKLYDLEVDVEELLKRAEKIETQVRLIKERMREAISERSRIMYI